MSFGPGAARVADASELRIEVLLRHVCHGIGLIAGEMARRAGSSRRRHATRWARKRIYDARAQSLITLELGPESQVERMQKYNEDGRVHYAELGRVGSDDVPVRGTIVALASDGLKAGRPSPGPRLQELSPVQLDQQVEYNGPTWLDQAIVSNWRPEAAMPGFAGDLQKALAARGRWLAERGLAQWSPAGARPQSHMMRDLREVETQRIVRDLSRRLNATFVAAPPGNRISGTYDHSFATPSGRIAVIRREDTFTLAPWKATLEPMRGRLVTGLVGPTRVSWTLDRGAVCPAEPEVLASVTSAERPLTFRPPDETIASRQ